MVKINFGWMFTIVLVVIWLGMVLGSHLQNRQHECPETQDPITMVVGCDAHERLIGRIVTEHHYNKLALDDVTAKFNACVMDLAVERGELPPLPGKVNK